MWAFLSIHIFWYFVWSESLYFPIDASHLMIAECCFCALQNIKLISLVFPFVSAYLKWKFKIILYVIVTNLFWMSLSFCFEKVVFMSLHVFYSRRSIKSSPSLAIVFLETPRYFLETVLKIEMFLLWKWSTFWAVLYHYCFFYENWHLRISRIRSLFENKIWDISLNV